MKTTIAGPRLSPPNLKDSAADESPSPPRTLLESAGMTAIDPPLLQDAAELQAAMGPRAAAAGDASPKPRHACAQPRMTTVVAVPRGPTEAVSVRARRGWIFVVDGPGDVWAVVSGVFRRAPLGALPSRPVVVFSFSRHCRRLLHDARPLLLDEGGDFLARAGNPGARLNPGAPESPSPDIVLHAARWLRLRG